jgi:catechol 2,3-dioxygenase-like lactoylglutathione lyase family enzyme
MIKVNEIAFVAYPVTDKQRARDFYEGLLGLKPTWTASSRKATGSSTT